MEETTYNFCQRFGNLHNKYYRPPSLRTDDDLQKEENVRTRAARWFGHPMYDQYGEIIKKLLRRKIPIDTIRRNIHRCMREKYKPGTNIPNWLRDSLDESEPFHMRIAHLKMRLSDVLQNEYGVKNEDELFHLSNVPALSEDSERKARELIRRAEEEPIDPEIRRLFADDEPRSCGKLMGLIDEILKRGSDADQQLDYTHITQTSRSVSRKKQSNDSKPSSSILESHRSTNLAEGAEESKHCPNSNVCCPAGFRLETRVSGQDTDAERAETQQSQREKSSRDDCELSDNSELTDYKFEDERPDELFDKLPPDSSIDDLSLEKRTKQKTNKNNSKQ